MRTSRNSSIAIAAVAVALFCAACGTPDEPSAAGAPAPTSAPTTVATKDIAGPIEMVTGPCTSNVRGPQAPPWSWKRV